MVSERQALPEGIDCLWLAVDQSGHIAALATGGTGPMPVSLLNSGWLDEVDVDARIAELPRVCGARLLVMYKRPDHYVVLAERGIYAYDWRDVHRPTKGYVRAYELIAVPSNPIKIAQLPDELAKVTRAVEFLDLRFDSANLLDVRSAMGCLEGG